MLDDFEKMLEEIDMKKAGALNIANKSESFEELDDIEFEDWTLTQHSKEVSTNILPSVAKPEHTTDL